MTQYRPNTPINPAQTNDEDENQSNDFTCVRINGSLVSEMDDIVNLSLLYSHYFGLNCSSSADILAALWVRLNHLLPTDVIRFNDVVEASKNINIKSEEITLMENQSIQIKGKEPSAPVLVVNASFPPSVKTKEQVKLLMLIRFNGQLNKLLEDWQEEVY